MSENEEKKEEVKETPAASEAKPAEVKAEAKPAAEAAPAAEAKPAEAKKPAAEAAPAAKPAAPAAEAGEPKKVKLSQLSLKEVEDEIKKTQEKMGGLNSHYGRFLVRRKQILTQKN